MIMELQVLPAPAGTDADGYARIDAAIAVIADSGLVYEVGPLGTSVEGPPDALWSLARRVHEAPLAAGAHSCVTIIKIGDGPAIPAKMSDLTGPHRT
jgi:uncharacterized protein YqgV (UPF0045/DUF77 family)